ncbi:hypothetical protein llap_14469 [Limosa lapponica baueri]|uniref:Rna-directed dna polymerase from mobile element jockey-like n=1 Tax=Limosa lapponica baueri TaxID=1758121 RepID=A0A2I0TN47_LIMLA|nr:hypothetical protein llap_14469 [Limosa lapponica baueri]
MYTLIEIGVNEHKFNKGNFDKTLGKQSTVRLGKLWNKLPRDIVASLSLEKFRTWLDKTLTRLIYLKVEATFEGKKMMSPLQHHVRFLSKSFFNTPIHYQYLDKDIEWFRELNAVAQV